MKIGDTLYCKNYFFNNCHFFPGDKFEIIDITSYHTLLKTKLDLTISMNNIKYGHIFLNKNRYIWDYLQTHTELRKDKLQSLENEI